MKHNIGDWVQVKYNNGTKILAKVTSDTTIQEFGQGAHYETEVDSWDVWQPEEGDYCWFGLSLTSYPFLAKFSHSKDNVAMLTTIPNVGYYTQDGSLPFPLCEPFIGNVPFVKGL